MSEEKRVRRTPEQIAADLDVQIEKLKDSILELENKKAASVTEFDKDRKSTRLNSSHSTSSRMPSSA